MTYLFCYILISKIELSVVHVFAGLYFSAIETKITSIITLRHFMKQYLMTMLNCSWTMLYSKLLCTSKNIYFSILAEYFEIWSKIKCCFCHCWNNKVLDVCRLDAIFRQIKSFIKVRLAFVFECQTFLYVDFSKTYWLKGLAPKNKGQTNFDERFDLTKKYN